MMMMMMMMMMILMVVDGGDLLRTAYCVLRTAVAF